MEFQNSDAIHAYVFNQFSRRKNGIRNLDPTAAAGEGPCAVTIGSGQNAIELNVSGGTPQIDGSPLAFQSTQVTLPDNTASTAWRQDLVYISEAGEVATLTGPTGTNRQSRLGSGGGGSADPSPEWYYPEGAELVTPEPDDAHALAGVLLARVTVPPGASTSQALIDDVDGRAVQDLRLPAVREPPEPWQKPNIGLEGTQFGTPGSDTGARYWSMTVRPGQAFELYMISQNHTREAWDGTWGDVDIEFVHDETGIAGGTATEVLSHGGDYLRGDPIGRVEVPTTAAARDVGLIQRNVGEEAIDGLGDVTLSASYEILSL